MMSVPEYLALLREKSGLTMYGLGKELGLKSKAHVWMLENGKRLPSISTCLKIISFARKYEINLTLDMLRGAESDSGAKEI